MEDGGWHFLKFLHQPFAGCDGLAQDGINERSNGCFAGLYGFVDGGVIRNVQDKQLAEADAEDVARFGIEFSLAEFPDPVIKDAAVAKDSEEDGLQESAVGRRKHASLRMSLDKAFRIVVAFGPCSEGGDGGLADVEVLGRQNSILI